MPNEIKIEITEKDLLTADQYISNTDCLLATCLKRAGFTGVKVRSCGEVDINGEKFETGPEFWSGTIEANGDEVSIGKGYKKSLLGKQFTLTPQ